MVCSLLLRKFRPETNRLIETPGTLYSSPSRKVKKQVNYVESDGEDDEDEVFKPLSGNRRAAKRRRISVKDDSDDDFGYDAATQAAMEDDDGTYFLQHTEQHCDGAIRWTTAVSSGTGVNCRPSPQAYSQ